MLADRLFYVVRLSLGSRLLLIYIWLLLRSRSLLVFTRYTQLMTLQAASLSLPVNRSKPLTISDLAFFWPGKGPSLGPQGPYVGPNPFSVHESLQGIKLGCEKVEASTSWKFWPNFIFFLASNYLVTIWLFLLLVFKFASKRGLREASRPLLNHCEPTPYLDSRMKSPANSSLLATCYSALFSPVHFICWFSSLAVCSTLFAACCLRLTACYLRLLFVVRCPLPAPRFSFCSFFSMLYNYFS